MTIPATQANKIKALYDIKAFADLIDFHGGWKSFGVIHNKLAGFITSPQCSIPCVSGGKRNKKKIYNRRRLVLMPRGHLKSTICSVLYVLWRIYRNPNIRVLYGSNVKDLSQTFIRELRHYLEDEDLQQSVWNKRPHISGRLIPLMDKSTRQRRAALNDYSITESADKKIIWNSNAIQVIRPKKLKEATVLACSVGMRVTGHHYDLLILDDIVDFDNCSSEIKVNKVFEWALDMESVVDPVREVEIGRAGANKVRELVGDEIIIVGTRYDKRDYYDYLITNKKELDYKIFKRNIYINGKDPQDGYIWGEKFNDEYVQKLKARLKISPKRWASQYLNEVIVSEEQSLNPDQIIWFKSAEIDKHDTHVEIRFQKEKHKVRLFMVCDPASSIKKGADNSAIVVGGYDENRNLFIIDNKLGRFTPQKLCENIFELSDKWSVFTLWLDANGVGASLPYTIREHFRHKRPLIIREIPKQKGDKKKRIEDILQPLMENGKFFMPQWFSTNEVLMAEFIYFPRATAKDDFLDACHILAQIASPTMLTNNYKGAYTPKLTINRKYGGVR